MAFEIALDNHLPDLTNHIDTTTLSIHGAYKIDDDPKVIEVTRVLRTIAEAKKTGRKVV